MYTLLSLLNTSGNKSSNPYVVHLKFVSIEEERTDIHSKSSDVICSQIEGKNPLSGYNEVYLPSVMEASVKLMRQREMSCNCAPLYNISYKYMTIADGWRVIHAFNPMVTGSSPEHGRVIVKESQEILIPGAGVRNMPRMNGLTLTYTDEYCVVQSDKLFTREIAWCIQSCMDLFNGKTIYDIIP